MLVMRWRIGLATAVLGVVLGGAEQASAGLTLTPQAAGDGFSLTTFAAGFPNSGSGGIGPLGIAFPSSGGVLVSDWWVGTVSLFPTDNDNQSYSGPGVTHQSNGSPFYFAPDGMTVSGGKVYLANQQSTGGSLQQGVYQLNDNGTVNHMVVALGGATGITTNPANGHLFVSANGHIYDVNPSNGNTVDWTATHSNSGSGADGLSFSPDGQTLYAAIFGSSVKGYNINTGAVVFSSAVTASDGTALGNGVLNGNIFANTNDGKLWEINLTSGMQTLIASGGSRGDFVTVDPNGTLLVTQTDRILRLTAPPGGGFGPAVPEPSTLISGGMASVLGLAYGWRRRKAATA